MIHHTDCGMETFTDDVTRSLPNLPSIALKAQKSSVPSTADPVPMKEYFRVAATKDGKPYELDLHRDGTIVEHAPFGPEEAKKLAMDKGYELIGEPRPVDEHFELLGKQDGKFYELQAHRDGKLVRVRPVGANDPRWGSLVR